LTTYASPILLPLSGAQGKVSSKVVLQTHASADERPAPGADGICSKLVIRFDYEIGEKVFCLFGCDEHRINRWTEKLVSGQIATAVLSDLLLFAQGLFNRF